MARWRTTEYQILEAMERLGGSFVKQLAILYRHGDVANRQKLAQMFNAYFQEYDELASQMLKQEVKK